jgi:predicted NUDIX family NTP pyrophosphohydrolase
VIPGRARVSLGAHYRVPLVLIHRSPCYNVAVNESAGLLMYRFNHGLVEVLLVHPGGPFWARKDEGVWSIPKGHIEPEETALSAACREFEEETGMRPRGNFHPLEPVKLKSRKTVYAWMFEGDFDPSTLKSVSFQMEWPPRSGKTAEFPEADRAAWFRAGEARQKISSGQRHFIDELEATLSGQASP